MNKRIKKKRSTITIKHLKKLMSAMMKNCSYSFEAADSTDEVVDCMNEFYNPLGFKAVCTNELSPDGILEIVLVKI